MRGSNDLHANDVFSANELAKVCTRPIVHDTVFEAPADIFSAHDELVAKRKLNSILRSKAVKDIYVAVGDIVKML